MWCARDANHVATVTETVADRREEERHGRTRRRTAVRIAARRDGRARAEFCGRGHPLELPDGLHAVAGARGRVRVPGEGGAGKRPGQRRSRFPKFLANRHGHREKAGPAVVRVLRDMQTRPVPQESGEKPLWPK